MTYDDWKLASGNEEIPVSRCYHCGTDLYKGETVHKYDGDTYCSHDCIIDELIAVNAIYKITLK